MSSFANYKMTLDQLQAATTIDYVPSILKMGFKTNQQNVPEGVKVNVVTYGLDDVVNGAVISTFDNTSVPLIKAVPIVFEFNHFKLENYITAKINENKGVEYFTSIANLYINDVLNRDFDKIAFNGYGNEGLFTGVVNGANLTGITTGKLLVDKIIELSIKANKDNNRSVNNSVSVLLSGSFNDLFATDFYSDSRSITQMIPSWIRIELSSNDKIITGNTITISSTNDVEVVHGDLPSIITPFELVNLGGANKFYQLGVGSSSVAVRKLNGKKVYSYKQL
jgi:hypothetical protein